MFLLFDSGALAPLFFVALVMVDDGYTNNRLLYLIDIICLMMKVTEVTVYFIEFNVFNNKCIYS